MLNSNELKALISATRQHINLIEAVIEKDYYVTQIIHALSGIENNYFKLIFAGGTCLAKAHKLVRRMSEDIDFKIQINKDAYSFSKTRLLKELKEFRALINSKLMLPNLISDEPIVRNEGQYYRIQINYPSTFSASAQLRPHILLEFSVSDIHLELECLSIKTIIEDTLRNVTIFHSPSTICVSVEETAIEKWVGLTRRIMAIERGYYYDDPTLVRHIYDLNAINKNNHIKDDFFGLALTIIIKDAKKFKNQHPEYAANPGSEITNSLEILKNKPIWASRYQQFIESMVYDRISPPDYKSSLQMLEHISSKVFDSLDVMAL